MRAVAFVHSHKRTPLFLVPTRLTRNIFVEAIPALQAYSSRPKMEVCHLSSVTDKVSILQRNFERFDRINPLTTFLLTALHGFALHQLLLFILGYETPNTGLVIYQMAVSLSAGISITAGAHRLWSHKAYKAKFPLRVILMVFQTLTFQGPLYTWVRWHRLHHKLSDRDGDPHDASRGFFYAHFGWLALYDHEKFLRNAAGQIKTTDLEKDEVVMWQHRNYYWWSIAMFSVQLLTPLALGLETSVWAAFNMICIGVFLNYSASSSVNSFAHMWGTRPYDKSIQAAQNPFVAFIALGEGWHNYHHAFPWDYKMSEYGLKYDITQAVIHFFYFIGWAYDLRTASVLTVERRGARTGDGSLGKLCGAK